MPKTFPLALVNKLYSACLILDVVVVQVFIGRNGVERLSGHSAVAANGPV